MCFIKIFKSLCGNTGRDVVDKIDSDEDTCGSDDDEYASNDTDSSTIKNEYGRDYESPRRLKSLDNRGLRCKSDNAGADDASSNSYRELFLCFTMANCQTPGKRSTTAEFPNLLLSTTYALNKSNSKRVSIGLEFSDGYYHQVIKLIRNAYLNNSYSFYYEFGHPVKIYLTNHDLNFSTAYGIKSITIDERPNNTQPSKEDKEGEIA
ncbi:hypothetical protein TSAR_013169 [Trichomalopsis sarcophagae]|uniref:Uncharacterized protein n=1 Tax=Trichomalopsis sarcophagae TaxID=543379 RepID=A0A232EP29_9HYME|nr:hypothetical protein TSAR_013169 [Trichomalopsis sarcophagae]